MTIKDFRDFLNKISYNESSDKVLIHLILIDDTFISQSYIKDYKLEDGYDGNKFLNLIGGGWVSKENLFQELKSYVNTLGEEYDNRNVCIYDTEVIPEDYCVPHCVDINSIKCSNKRSSCIHIYIKGEEN